MSQQLRVNDEQHYYHIMSRGANKQKIFLESADYKNFIKLMKIYSEKYPVDILAYCLMPNHFHILLYNNNNNMPKFMRCIKQIYSASFNKKHKRIGPLFNDRYKAKVILNEQYLNVVFRYILLNPQKSGICDFKNYMWSSYSSMQNPNTFISVSLLNEVIGNPKLICKSMEISNEDYLSYSDDPICDYELKFQLKEKFGLYDVSQINNFNSILKNKILEFLYDKGLSILKISQLTNISYNRLYVLLKSKRTCN